MAEQILDRMSIEVTVTPASGEPSGEIFDFFKATINCASLDRI
jgi:hypothetical protein